VAVTRPGELFPLLRRPPALDALRFGGETLRYPELADAAGGVARLLAGTNRVAILATPTLDTVVGAVGALAAGAAVVPLNPSAAPRELEHILKDSAPEAIVSGGGDLPETLLGLPRVSPRGPGAEYVDTAADDPERTALVLYTSGTTGLPKGAEIPRRAITTNLDALAQAWQWTGEDRLAHALPLFHIHGLVLGTFGPLRLGGEVEHVGRFAPEALARALDAGATMVFGVPTMYHRIAIEAGENASVAEAFASARLLVSGSAALPVTAHQRISEVTGRAIHERYGMTETMMNAGVRVGDEVIPGRVGRAIPGVEIELVDDAGNTLETDDDETIGEIAVRGPNLFAGYLNRPEETAETMRDGWFMTGDLATRDATGSLRLVGRRATDLIKSGGYRIGAGEIEGALLEHPAVSEVAVTGRPDPDLGERVAAWVVTEGGQEVEAEELVAHVGELLSGHKRPREVHFVDSLPRNEMGKVVKRGLR
jgi:malonyl-CoA/methylmalonyl-CoA synthetase